VLRRHGSARAVPSRVTAAAPHKSVRAATAVPCHAVQNGNTPVYFALFRYDDWSYWNDDDANKNRTFRNVCHLPSYMVRVCCAGPVVRDPYRCCDHCSVWRCSTGSKSSWSWS
jgi:hypothetical protein